MSRVNSDSSPKEGRARTDKRGFTLIEVVVALVILSISFTWLLASTGQSIDMATRSKFLTTSTLLAQKRIADVESSSDARSPGENTGDFGTDYLGYTYSEKIDTTPLDGCYRYTLTVKWGERGSLESDFTAFLTSK